MDRTWYRLLWILEVIAIVAMALVLTVPIRDYALPEFKEWQWHPSASTLAHFQEKQQEEVGLRRTAAASFAIAAVLLAIRLFSRRQNQKDSI